MTPRPTGPLLVLFGLITAAGGWLLLFGGQGTEPRGSTVPNAPLLAAPPTTGPPPPPPTTAPPTSAGAVTTTAPVPTTAPPSPYGAREDGSWVLPALDGGPDVDSQQFAEDAMVLVVAPRCAECLATAQAASEVAAAHGYGAPIVIVTHISNTNEDDLRREVQGWPLAGVRYAMDVWLGDHWARSDILPDALPIVGLWNGGSGHSGGWSLLADGARDRGAIEFLLAASAHRHDPPFVENPDILGDGWEVMDVPWGPAPRYQAAATIVGDRIVIWGGVGDPFDDRQPSITEGWVWNAADGWERMADGPLCPLLTPGALTVGDEVVIWGGAPANAECAQQAVYDPGTDTWRTIESQLFRRAGRSTGVARTGEWLVGPTTGWAFDFATGADIEIPRVPTMTAESSPVRAHWTGDQVLAIGPGPLYGWRPGDAEWEILGSPQIGRIARDSVLAGDVLWLVNYDMATATFSDGEWQRTESLPLRFYECVPEAGRIAGAAANAVAVRMCSGYAVLDDARGSWVVLPLGGDLGHVLYGSDAIYEIGADLRRLEIRRDSGGRIELPRSIPVGVFQLEIGSEWDLVSSVGSTEVQRPGEPPEEVQAFAVENAAGARCRVVARYAGGAGRVAAGSEYRETVSARTGRVHPTLVVPAGAGDDFEHVVVASYNGSDVVDITCNDTADAFDLATRLWSYWE